MRATRAAPPESRARVQREILNSLPIFQCIILPWLFFCLVFYIMSFSLRYDHPWLCSMILATCIIVAVLIAGAAMTRVLKKLEGKEKEAERPSWLVFLAITLSAGLILGALFGDLNFSTHMRPYYTCKDQTHYYDIDPRATSSQELNDAGLIDFQRGAALDLSRSMGFMNYDIYCVAPINVRRPDGSMPPLDEYNFWAIGLDCCSLGKADFHCGEFDNPQSHTGLRLMEGSDQQAFFELAVRQAESAYTIKAPTPVFLYWSSDATAEMNSFQNEGLKFYLIATLLHFGWQLLCVALAAVGFSKMGHY